MASKTAAVRRTRRQPHAEDNAPRLSRTRRPPAMPVADWQAALRRQYGREQTFGLHNLGDDPVYSDFEVHNPESRRRYRVAIRGAGLGRNRCTCPDYGSNELGTCKHIEFTLAKLQARRGGKAALARGFQPAYSEVWLDHAGPRRVRLHAGTSLPSRLLTRARMLFDEDAGWALRDERLHDLPAWLKAAHAQDHEVRCDEEVYQHIAELRDRAHRAQVLDAAYPRGAADPALRKLLPTRLHRYQAEGALFIARAGRALLGDEMGLGKTIQGVAAAELLARHFGVQRVLVVCPTSLKHQWRAEFRRHAGREVQVVQGLRPQRERQYREEATCRITTYDTLARDLDLVAGWAPEFVIADEAQRIKNWNTVAARALKQVASPYALVLTGTPLENRLEELISIVQFVDQHRLGPTWRLLDEHQTRDDAGRVIGYRALDRIAQTLAPVMLRRRKSEVLAQLPERVDQRIDVPLTPQQRRLHDDNGLVVTRIVARWRKTGYLSDADQRRLQCALQNMRMACNSTWLLDHETDHGHKVDELMAVLEELLHDPAAKVVVFSQWLGTHELIRRRLAARAQRDGAGWGHVLFSGQVPAEQRGTLVQRFHDDPQCRLFLSTDAGGVGLNLQHAAAVVVNMDLPWNPAVLEQRIGRVHRMGQSRGVQVIQFVGQGSIEEGMLSVLAFKKSLFAGVLDGGSTEVFLQGTRLSKFLESVEQVAAAMGEGEAEAETTAAPEAGTALEPALAPSPAPASASASASAPVHVQPTTAPPSAGTAPVAVPTATPDPWAALLQAGAAMLQGLAASRQGASAGPAPFSIERDPATGQASLRVPLPDADVLRQLAQALQPWLQAPRE